MKIPPFMIFGDLNDSSFLAIKNDTVRNIVLLSLSADKFQNLSWIDT